MKMMTALLSLTFSLTVFAGQGKGGGNFDHMKSVTALNKAHFDTIVKDNGASFIGEIILPNILLGVVQVVADESSHHDSSTRKNMIDPRLRRMWTNFLKNKTGSQLERELKRVKISPCACPENIQKEYTINHACSLPDEQKICLDLPKILNPKKPVRIDFHELTAMIWHEFTHLRIGNADHENDLLFYKYVLTQSQLANSLKVDGFVTSKIAECQIDDVKLSKKTKLLDCLQETMKARDTKITTKFHNVRMEVKNPMSYTSAKTVQCTLEGISSSFFRGEDTWLQWLSQFTFVKKETYRIDLSAKEFTSSDLAHASQIFPSKQKIYSSNNLGVIKTFRTTINECMKHFYYVQTRDDLRLFSQMKVSQGDFEVRVTNFDRRNFFFRMNGKEE